MNSKGITPIIAIILLVLITIVSSVAAFVWIGSVQTRTQEVAGGSIEGQGAGSCSRINIISARGDGIYLQNTGCDELDSVTILINGELTNYDLQAPLSPGASTFLTFTEGALEADQPYSYSATTSSGGTTTYYTSAAESSEEAGYCESGTTVCGNNVCESNCETVFNCCRDCCVKSILIEDASALRYFSYIESAPSGVHVLGNRTLLYTPTGSIAGSSFKWINERNVIYLFPEDGAGIRDLYAFVFNGTWGSKMQVTNNACVDSVVIGEPDENGRVDIAYTNCSADCDIGRDGCDVYYMNWSITSSFSQPIKITNINTTRVEVDQLFIDSSRTENKKVLMYYDGGSDFINYSIFNNGAWSNFQTLNLGNNHVKYVSMNDIGAIALIVGSGSSGRDLFYYDLSSWTNISYIHNTDVVLNSYGSNFMFIINKTNSYDYKIFADGVFFKSGIYSNQTSSILTPYMSRTQNNDLVSYFVQADSLGIKMHSWNGYNTWSSKMNITWCGLGGCELYEACSSECSSETWCSDGVDNDEDGLFDSADSGDCP